VAGYAARALALKKTRLGEADLIVTFLASDGRQLRAVAKGARKTTSRFGARLEPFSVVDLMLAEGRTLDIVTEAQTVRRHNALCADLDRLSAGSVVLDFADKVSVECQSEARLFELAITALDVIETAPVDALPVLIAAFLLKGMAMLGYRPALSACAACGRQLSDAGAWRFSLEAGGVVCAGCVSEGLATTRVSADAVQALSALLWARLAEVDVLDLCPSSVAECLSLVRSFVAYHVPARMKALEMYGAGMS